MTETPANANSSSNQIDPADLDMLHQAVKEAHVPSLLACLVHITGDTSLLIEERRPKAMSVIAAEVPIPAQEQDAIREIAVREIQKYLQRGKSLPPDPSWDTIRTMMEFVAGEPIRSELLPLLREELAVEGADMRRPDWHAKDESAAGAGMHVVVIGGGMSGILAAIRLQQAGVPFTVIEKNEEIGGTWWENDYPGCRIDVENHTYSYSFEPNPDWHQVFPGRDEILQYFIDVVERYELRQHMRLGVGVTEMRFDEAESQWRIKAVDREGTPVEITASAVINAVGQLNRPLIPVIAGQEQFDGPSFHSAQWRHDIDLTGKRVGVIGTGASAFQFVPKIAETAEHVVVFQRNPPWLIATPTYFDEVSDSAKWLFRTVPSYLKWYRLWIWYSSVEGIHGTMMADPDWTGPAHSIGERNAAMRDFVREGMLAQLQDSPELADKVIPDYPFGSKRMLRDPGAWIDALKRDDVTLETDPIGQIAKSGVITENGVEHDLDILIYGTGFQASKFLTPMRIFGRGGIELHDVWQADARAYLGMLVPDFPNFFCVYGPNTNLVTNGSLVFFSECAVGYILQCLEHLLDEGKSSVEIRRDVYDEYNMRVDEANSNMAWGVTGVSNWYKSASGRVSQNWPFPTFDYWNMTRKPDPEQLDVR